MFALFMSAGIYSTYWVRARLLWCWFCLWFACHHMCIMHVSVGVKNSRSSHTYRVNCWMLNLRCMAPPSEPFNVVCVTAPLPAVVVVAVSPDSKLYAFSCSSPAPATTDDDPLAMWPCDWWPFAAASPPLSTELTWKRFIARARLFFVGCGVCITRWSLHIRRFTLVHTRATNTHARVADDSCVVLSLWQLAHRTQQTVDVRGFVRLMRDYQRGDEYIYTL